MGNSFTYDYKTLGDALLPEYEYVETAADIRFGNIGIFVLKSDRRESNFFKVVDGEDPQVGVLRELSERKLHCCHPNLLRLIKFPDVLAIDESSPAGGTTAFSLLFETWDSTFANRLDDYLHEGRTFSEEQLHQLLLACMDVLAFLQSLIIPHGYLVPESILIVNGGIKLAPHSLLQGPFDIVNKLDSVQVDYVAPEVLASRGTSIFRLNMFKADVFSLGMIILRSALLSTFRNIYDSKQSVDHVALTRNLLEMERFYSKDLTDRVRQMLSVDPASRPDPMLLMRQLQSRLTVKIHTPERIAHNSSVYGCRQIDSNLRTSTTSPLSSYPLVSRSPITTQHYFPPSKVQPGTYGLDNYSSVNNSSSFIQKSPIFEPAQAYLPASQRPESTARMNNFLMEKLEFEAVPTRSHYATPSQAEMKRSTAGVSSFSPKESIPYKSPLQSSERQSYFALDEKRDRKSVSPSPAPRPPEKSSASISNNMTSYSRTVRTIEDTHPPLPSKGLGDSKDLEYIPKARIERVSVENQVYSKPTQSFDHFKKSPSPQSSHGSLEFGYQQLVLPPSSLNSHSSNFGGDIHLGFKQHESTTHTVFTPLTELRRTKYSIAMDISDAKDLSTRLKSAEDTKMAKREEVPLPSTTFNEIKLESTQRKLSSSYDRMMLRDEAARKSTKGISFAENLASDRPPPARESKIVVQNTQPSDEILRGTASGLRSSLRDTKLLPAAPAIYKDDKPMRLSKGFETKPSVGMAQPLSNDEIFEPVSQENYRKSLVGSINISGSIREESSDFQSQPDSWRGSEKEEAKISETQLDIIQVFPDGARYEGNLVKGMRHGFGRFIYPGGGYYEGNWIVGKMEGFGRLFYSNGMLAYEGNWQEDKFHGKGILVNDAPDLSFTVNYKDFSNLGNGWSKYEGEFWNDVKEGAGTCYFADGSIYEGKFKGDRFEGEGRFQSRDGYVILGFWTNNKLVKEVEA